MLKNQIELSADQAKTLVKFLSAQESLLKCISVYDKEDAKQALNKVFRLIADYGRKVRERKGTRELIENRESKVTSRQIRAWIRKGKLEAFDLPGLGIIIEAEKLNEFLNHKNS